MKNLFEPSTMNEIQDRLAKLRPDSPRQWGSMGVAQALAHCSLGLQLPSGELRPPSKVLGRVVGRIIKPLVLGNDKPMRRGAPTMIAVEDNRDFNAERERLRELIDRFAAAGPAGCTKHPHSFFGPLTPDEWAILMYKHLDHHLRQFGA
jgi:transposase InsO family protein